MFGLVRRAWARLGPRRGTWWRRGGAVLLAAATLCAAPAAAREVSVAGKPMERFGRIAFEFDQVTPVDVKITNNVLVIRFGAPSRIKSEKLATELGRYVTAVRRDPDDTGLRLALAGPMRTNVLFAAEKVFVDLLPPNWSGVLPGLPPEVIAALSERLRVAEEKTKRDDLPKVTFPPVKVRLARLPTLTRVTFEPPAGLSARAVDKGGAVEVAFGGDAKLDFGQDDPKLAPGVRGFEITRSAAGVAVKLSPGVGYAAHGSEDDGTIVVDLSKPSDPAARPLPAADGSHAPAPAAAGVPPSASVAAKLGAPAAGEDAKPAAPKPAGAAPRPADPHGDPAAAAPAGATEPVLPIPPRRDEAAHEVVPVRPVETLAMPALVTARFDGDDARSSLAFPFRSRTPAAAYIRDGLLTLVFGTRDRVDGAALAAQVARSMTFRDAVAADGYLVVRFADVRLSPVRLVPDGTEWRLLLGDAAVLAPDSPNVNRTLDESGHSIVTVGLSNGSEVHWMREPDGRRVAVVPAYGRAQALPLPRNYVEFNLPPTLQGVLVEALSDDLTVALGQAGVVVTRDGGLSLSPIGRVKADGSAATQLSGLVIARDLWVADGSGNVLERYRDLVSASANASRSGRAEARYRLARFLLANGMNFEASRVMAWAGQDDPVFALRHDPVVLTAAANALARRFGVARTLLSAADYADDPESILWRSVADAGERRWKTAMAGFRRVTDVIELYPDELAGAIRLAVLNTAIEQDDVRKAEGELAALDRLAIGSIPGDEHDLARARVDEAAGRNDVALREYAAVIESGRDRARAEAILRQASLAFRTKTMTLTDATDRLETLLAIWHGGDIEVGATVELARLYGRAKRWRDMLAMTRRADKYFPQHDLTRSLHEESARTFEQLLLGDGETLLPVQALALFFDFREFTPAGRRGDELVRRLADRLVELDLLDQAADLLQYQVDNRLTGVARSTVAARLAAIRLMNGKPIQALEALHRSRLAELPADVRQFRLLLEARAQADISRTDLALELTEGASGPDFARLKTGILWSARRWREAGEAAEGLLGTRWNDPDPLSDRERGDVIQAAVAYVLAEERLAIDRIGQKFSAKMADSPSAKTFAFLLEPKVGQTREFRAVAQEASRTNALREVLADWRTHHPDLLVEPRDAPPPAPPAADEPKGAPRADATPAPTNG